MKAGGNDPIPLSIPSIQGNEWKYIKECLDTGWVSSVGKYVDRFEADMARFTRARYAVACVNGTAALQVALRLVGVTAGDEVIVPTLTFIAPVNAAQYLGAEPVFMDCDACYNLDTVKTIEFIRTRTEPRRVGDRSFSFNKKTGRRISALIPVHVFGHAVNFEGLADLCAERNIPIVEDATESLGIIYREGAYQGRHAGTVGAVGCISFNGNKIITTGGGGMILTDNPEYARRAKYLTTQAKDDELRYVHHEVGYNFRLTNIQAALGVAQLEQLPKFLEIKKTNFKAYKQAIDRIAGLRLADPPDYADNNCWMYALQVDEKAYGESREELMKRLWAEQIQVRPVWYLNHLQKPYAACAQFKIETADELWQKTLNLPCSVSLSKEQLDRVVQCLIRAEKKQ